MPPKEMTIMGDRCEFVLLATQAGANVRALCRHFEISSRTGYTWIARYRTGGLDALADRSRRPASSPRRTDAAVEAAVLAARDAHPDWGGRTIAAWLGGQGMVGPPAPSTITAILRRHGRLGAGTTGTVQGPFCRFEHPEPNDLWQMDFMGHRPLGQGPGRVHPLTILDDHSRFGLSLLACPTQRRAPVQTQLTAYFRRYGVPRAILTDNGPPWGPSRGTGLTGLEAWLIRHGIRVVHGRPLHPQTQGTVERWHRTIGQAVFGPTSRLPCPTWPPPNAPSTASARSTTPNAPTTPWGWRSRPAGTGPVPAPSPRRCPRRCPSWSTMTMMRSGSSGARGRSCSPATGSSSARGSRASRSGSGRRSPTGSGPSTMATTRSPPSTSGPRDSLDDPHAKCPPCLRTPVCHVSGLYNEVLPGHGDASSRSTPGIPMSESPSGFGDTHEPGHLPSSRR